MKSFLFFIRNLRFVQVFPTVCTPVCTPVCTVCTVCTIIVHSLNFTLVSPAAIKHVRRVSRTHLEPDFLGALNLKCVFRFGCNRFSGSAGLNYFETHGAVDRDLIEL